VETDFALAASTTAPMAEITTVLPGQTAEIVVQAVNGSSQGVASEPAFVPVAASAPVAVAKVPSAGATLVEEQEEDVAHVAPLTNGTNGTPRENGSVLAGAR